MCWTVRQVMHTYMQSCMNRIIGTVGFVSTVFLGLRAAHTRMFSGF